MRLALCALLAVSACYAPTTVGGAPCDLAKDNCPTGQTCMATGSGNFCSRGGGGPEIDSGTPTIDGSNCLGGHLLGSLCLQTPPTAALNLASSTINSSSTNAGNCSEIRAQVGGPSICLVVATQIDIATGVTVRAIGPNPVVFVATRTITVNGAIDASSHAGETIGGSAVPGAGARSALECNAIGTDGTTSTNDTNGGGGAAGGSFGGLGGAGGNGRNGVAHGNPAAPSAPLALTGGCPGGRGGDGSGGLGGGLGGLAGGAIYLLAGDSISISGKLNASGAGGGAGTAGMFSSGAGGGGGAGGMIGLEAPRLTIAGTVFANGGGGGGGGGNQATDVGGPGADPVTAATAATGGSGGNNGGGGGGVGSTSPPTGGVGKAGNNQQCAGGGGGGGGGVIRLYGTQTTTGTISPPAT